MGTVEYFCPRRTAGVVGGCSSRRPAEPHGGPGEAAVPQAAQQEPRWLSLGRLRQPASISCPRLVSRSSPMRRSRVSQTSGRGAVQPVGKADSDFTANRYRCGCPQPWNCLGSVYCCTHSPCLLLTSVGRNGVEVGPLCTFSTYARF